MSYPCFQWDMVIITASSRDVLLVSYISKHENLMAVCLHERDVGVSYVTTIFILCIKFT